MYGALRHGRLALRVLRSLPSTSISSSRSHLLASTPRAALSRPVAVAYFSSTTRYRQYALAEEDDTPATSADFGAEDISATKREFTTFAELGQAGIVDPKIVDTVVNQMKIHTMTEVQRMTLNECLDGTDVVAQARTGTGKTLAFLLPIVQRILKDPSFDSARPSIQDTRALIISPTRELAEQIGVEAKKIVRGTGVQVQMAVGGTQKQHHLRMMQTMGCHILVGTPGRVKDLLSDPYNGLSMDKIQTFVLDEADRLLDIGFADDIREIQSYMPREKRQQRQTLMFSATMPRSVVGLVRETMKPDFKFVRTIDPAESATHDSITQHIVFLDGLQNQIPALVEIAVNAIEAHKRDPANNLPFKAIVFLRSLNEVKLAYQTIRSLRDRSNKSGLFAAHPLEPCNIIEMSSQLDQRQRTSNSQAFRHADSAIMISSDVTARGMDFPNVSHVIQIGIPNRTEDYVHRLGRTGRAGKPGQGWLLLQQDERLKYRKLAESLQSQNIFEDKSLATASLDMTQPSQLSPQTARIMQLVESGVRSVSIMDKGRAYQSLLTVLNQAGNSARPQIVDQVNQLATFGWGLESPPFVAKSWAEKTGFARVPGLVMRDDNVDRDGHPRFPNRNREHFDDRDPFGQGAGSAGRGSFGGRGGSAGRGSFDGRGGSSNSYNRNGGGRGFR